MSVTLEIKIGILFLETSRSEHLETRFPHDVVVFVRSSASAFNPLKIFYDTCKLALNKLKCLFYSCCSNHHFN